jgi:hypothetical protein
MPTAIIHAAAREAQMTGKKKFIVVVLNSLIFLAFTGLFGGIFANGQAVPQTARQALLEMFFSKTPGTFEKHLPQATRTALRKAGSTSSTSFLTGFSAMTSQLTTHGQQLQTFEAGPTLVQIEDPQTHNKFEITMERDDLLGDEDDLELSFHGSKDGETQTAGAKFGLTFTMKQEASIWRLSAISATVGVSLTDPEFLKALDTKLRPGISAAPAGDTTTLIAPNAMTAANESAAVGAVRAFNTAEISYAATFPGHGFTCTLSDLGGMGSGSGVTEHQAMLIDPRLASGRKNGYVFALTGCDGTPASRYSITAVPADPTSGIRAFCSDESAVIRFSIDGKANSCLNMGKPLQ